MFHNLFSNLDVLILLCSHNYVYWSPIPSIHKITINNTINNTINLFYSYIDILMRKIINRIYHDLSLKNYPLNQDKNLTTRNNRKIIDGS